MVVDCASERPPGKRLVCFFFSAQRSILVTGWRRSSEQGRLRKPAAEPSGGWVFILDE